MKLSSTTTEEQKRKDVIRDFSYSDDLEFL